VTGKTVTCRYVCKIGYFINFKRLLLLTTTQTCWPQAGMLYKNIADETYNTDTDTHYIPAADSPVPTGIVFQTL